MQPVQLLSCKDVRPNIVTMLAMGISTWPAVEPCFPSYSRKPGAKSWFERVEFGVARSTRCKLWPTLAVDGSHRCVLETGARPESTTNPSCQQNHSSFRHHLYHYHHHRLITQHTSCILSRTLPRSPSLHSLLLDYAIITSSIHSPLHPLHLIHCAACVSPRTSAHSITIPAPV